MALEQTHCWTFGGLMWAFVDLSIAYLLLFGSAIAFFASKIFNFFGLPLPCPSCKGSFGYKNSELCLHKILFEWPLKKICSIQVMAAKRFPFDLVWVKKGHSSSSNAKVVTEKTYDSNRIVELEDEAHCSSGFSLVDKESGYDAKGKKIMSMKRRSRIRRKRRSSSDCGKISLVASCDNLQSDVALTSCINKDITSEGIHPASDDEDAQTSHHLDEQTIHKLNGSVVERSGEEKYLSSLERHASILQDNIQIIENEDNRIKMLENALQEEKTAYAALYLELEKERSAASSAAEEAMSMILRLQEEKASMELEMKHYQSIIEERIAYDAEEMNILQEILIRREMENFSLEKELEGYRQMGLKGSYQSSGTPKEELEEWGQSFETFDNPPQTESTISIVKNDVISDISSDFNVAWNRINTEHGEELQQNTVHKDQAQECDDLNSSFYDTESDVLDVHVIDDNIEHKEMKKENEKSSTVSKSRKPPRPHPRSRSCDNNVDGSTSQLPMFYYSKHRAPSSDSGSDSSWAAHDEKLKIDNEIEILEERLRMVKHEKEKLTSFAEKGEGEKGRFKLLENLANHLQKIKQSRIPVRGASLPPPRPKVNMKKNRSQSAKWESC